MQRAAVPPQLVVRSDISMLRRRFRIAQVLYGVLIVLTMAAIALLSFAPEQTLRNFTFVFLLLLAGQIFQLCLQCYHWGGRLAISQPLTIDAWGLELQGQRGTVRLPWEAVPEVRQRSQLGHQQLAFMVHPHAVPGQNGVEADPTLWSQYQKRGLLIGGTGIAPGLETILPAIGHYSQGRTRIV